MIKQVLPLFLLLIVITTIKSEPSAKNVLTFNCQKMLDVIKKGTFEKLQKELEDCRVSCLS